MYKILFIGIFASICLSSSALDITCRNLVAQNGLNMTRMTGEWYMIKTSTESDVEPSCIRARVMDLFREDKDKFMVYYRYPRYDEELNPFQRFYGIKIQNEQTPGHWTMKYPGLPYDMISVYVLHSDYKSTLGVICVQYDGDVWVDTIGMFGRERILSGETVMAYQHYLNTFGIDVPFYDVSHDNSCTID